MAMKEGREIRVWKEVYHLERRSRGSCRKTEEKKEVKGKRAQEQGGNQRESSQDFGFGYQRSNWRTFFKEFYHSLPLSFLAP